MPFPVEIGTRQEKFDAAPELKERGEWVCLNVEPSCPWPVRPQPVEFAGERIWIVPLTQEEYGGVAMQLHDGMTTDDAASLMHRLLSVISWREDSGVIVVHQTGGSWPMMMGIKKKIGFAIREQFDFTETVCPEEEEPRIALALMREARSLNHYGYAFLSFWRVLELAFPKPKARVAWMEAALPTLKAHDLKEAFDNIAEKVTADICRHLFESNRCAVAHASGRPIVNPDDPRDARRLRKELPIVRELAVRAIEERFGIPTSKTEYQQHLYELRGWKEVLGADLIARLLRGEGPAPEEHVDLPEINVRLRERPPYAPFEHMQPINADVEGAKVILIYGTADGLMQVRFQLNLAEERLHFAIDDGIYGHDDGSVAAAEYQAEFQRFLRDYFLNGELQIFNAETGAFLSRKDAFLPTNCYVDLDNSNAIIADAMSEVERRRNALDGG